MAWRGLIARGGVHRAYDAPLALGLDVRRRMPSRNAWAPSRSEALDPRVLAAGHGVEIEIAARPLVRSRSTGAWIKGDASWEALRFPAAEMDPHQARWFVDLRALARDPRHPIDNAHSAEWLALDKLTAPLLGAHLARAAELGIPIVGARKNVDVDVVDDADVVIGVERFPGGLRVRAGAWLGDASRTDARALGSGGVYVCAGAEGRITVTLGIHPLAPPLVALLAERDGVVVPADEESEFLRDAVPALARVAEIVAGEGVALPEPVAPALVVGARLRARGVRYQLRWRYAGVQEFAYAPDRHPVRDAALEAEVRARVEQAWAEVSPLAFSAAGTLSEDDAAEFVLRVLPALDALDGVVVEREGKTTLTAVDADPRITVTTVESPDADWFDLGVIVTVDGRTIPFAPLFTALTIGRKRLLLADGRYFSLAHPALDQLRELIDEAATLEEWQTGPRISRYQTALWEDFEDLADVAEPAVTWRARTEGLRGASEVPRLEPPAGLTATLRPYQQSGFEWLAFLRAHDLGGILADDMGLGKTVQVLALAEHARATRTTGERRPFLVVAPTSLLPVWRDEATRFTPGLRVHVAGETERRAAVPLAAAAEEADVIVTSYAVLRLAEEAFRAITWDTVVLDEAQFVKNHKTQAHRAIASLRRDSTIAVTGTPLENSLADLWALLSLTAPGLFASHRRFRDEYIGPIEKGKVPENQEGGPYRAARLERLRRRIRPFLLRRTKEQVATELPPKQEQIHRVELSPAHRALYDVVLQRERQKVLGLLDDLDKRRFIVFRSLTLLRMLALAPGLIDETDASIGSAKLDALLDRITEVTAEGHRALVFSQFTSFLALARDRLAAAGVRTTYLDGATRDRGAVVSQFREGEADVFLISLKAGGFGLTLTEADYVFLLDPWWNPAAEAQAIDRTHRIGQDKPVFVYRLVAADTIEEKVLALQRRKARLFGAVVDDGDAFAGALSADDIRSLFDER